MSWECTWESEPYGWDSYGFKIFMLAQPIARVEIVGQKCVEGHEGLKIALKKSGWKEDKWVTFAYVLAGVSLSSTWGSHS